MSTTINFSKYLQYTKLLFLLILNKMVCLYLSYVERRAEMLVKHMENESL